MSSFPKAPAGVPATPRPELDRSLERLQRHKERWREVGHEERVRMLREVERRLVMHGRAWAAACALGTGYNPEEDGAGEALLVSAVVTLRALRQYREALVCGGQPKLKTQVRPNGQVMARVLPVSAADTLLFPRVTADVWLEPGADPTQGRIYRESHPDPGRVALVLGAGNIPSIAPTDALHKLLAEDQVVLLKMNPVNEYCGPFLEQIFAPFIEAGFLAVAYGGADEGKYLCAHDLVDTLHITGSDQTYDAIVWGETAEERAAAKAKGQRRLDKHFTSELGNVTPILVVPGRWSKRELAWQARHVVAAVAHNASFDCVAGKVLVLARGWEQRDAFVSLVKEGLRSLPPRKAYYPGAEGRYAEMCSRYPDAEALGARGEFVVPWTYFPDVSAQRGEPALTKEAFCGVLAEVNLDVREPEDYLREATRFCNDDVWGTLACFVLTGGQVETRHRDAFENALEELRYGTIGVNLWPGAIFGFMSPSWGAFPGHTDVDIQSGRGVVHNTFLLDHPQKSVVRSPVRLPVTPPWFADHRNLLGVGQSLLRLEQRYSPLGVALAFPSLLKG